MAMKRKVFAVISSRRTGRHGSEQRWFGTQTEAGRWAHSLLANSQIGRSTRHTSVRSEPVHVYVVQVLDVVEIAAQPVIYRKVTECDVDSVFFKKGSLSDVSLHKD